MECLKKIVVEKQIQKEEVHLIRPLIVVWIKTGVCSVVLVGLLT